MFVDGALILPMASIGRRWSRVVSSSRQLDAGALDSVFVTWLHASTRKTTRGDSQYLSGTGSNPSTHTSSGYTRNNGTYVAPYVATNPNSTQRDNFGTSGNYNPDNGRFGSRTPRY